MYLQWKDESALESIEDEPVLRDILYHRLLATATQSSLMKFLLVTTRQWSSAYGVDPGKHCCCRRRRVILDDYVVKAPVACGGEVGSSTQNTVGFPDKISGVNVSKYVCIKGKQALCRAHLDATPVPTTRQNCTYPASIHTCTKVDNGQFGVGFYMRTT